MFNDGVVLEGSNLLLLEGSNLTLKRIGVFDKVEWDAIIRSEAGICEF